MPTDNDTVRYFTVFDEESKPIRLSEDELLSRFKEKYFHDESFQEMFAFDREMSAYGCIVKFASLLDVSFKASLVIASVNNDDPLSWYGKTKRNLFQTLFIVTFVPVQVSIDKLLRLNSYHYAH